MQIVELEVPSRSLAAGGPETPLFFSFCLLRPLRPCINPLQHSRYPFDVFGMKDTDGPEAKKKKMGGLNEGCAGVWQS